MAYEAVGAGEMPLGVECRVLATSFLVLNSGAVPGGFSS